MKPNNPVTFIFWVVDDNNGQTWVSGPITDCINQFVSSLATPNRVQARMLTTEFAPETDPVLRSSLAWTYVVSVERGAIVTPCGINRPVEFVVYGFEDWDPLKAFLAGNLAGPAGVPLWPQLVLTDLYKGVLTQPKATEDIQKLPGYSFAMDCVARHIPCIAFSSSDGAIHEHSPLFQSRCFHYTRDEFKQSGKVFRTLRDRLWGELSRKLWIPEFKLAVEGRKNPGANTFDVTFTSAGKRFSHVANVSATPYAYLYLWAYGSTLARLKGWDAQLKGWDESDCVAVSKPPPKILTLSGNKKTQIGSTWGKLFEPRVRASRKEDIYYVPNGDVSERTADILNANIIHLDVPTAVALPMFWDHPPIKRNLWNSLREILPPDGLDWLHAVTSLGLNETCKA